MEDNGSDHSDSSGSDSDSSDSDGSGSDSGDNGKSKRRSKGKSRRKSKAAGDDEKHRKERRDAKRNPAKAEVQTMSAFIKKETHAEIRGVAKKMFSINVDEEYQSMPEPTAQEVLDYEAGVEGEGRRPGPDAMYLDIGKHPLGHEKGIETKWNKYFIDEAVKKVLKRMRKAYPTKAPSKRAIRVLVVQRFQNLVNLYRRQIPREKRDGTMEEVDEILSRLTENEAKRAKETRRNTRVQTVSEQVS